MWFGRQWLSRRQAWEVCFRDVAFGEELEFSPGPGGVLGNLRTSCKDRRVPSAVTPGKHFQSEKYLAFLFQVIWSSKANPWARNPHQILSQRERIPASVSVGGIGSRRTSRPFLFSRLQISAWSQGCLCPVPSMKWGWQQEASASRGPSVRSLLPFVSWVLVQDRCPISLLHLPSTQVPHTVLLSVCFTANGSWNPGQLLS